MMEKRIRIGTRDSELALWQAHHVEKLLNENSFETEIISVKSEGDIILDKPLYEFGITGIFTKTLDVAMITGKIDIAVHSLKDVPTALPKGIVQAAVLRRASEKDILVYNDNLDFLRSSGTIATGSLRRRAQWLNRHPNHEVDDIRGNVNTRLKKLSESRWNAAIFAEAGLDRINKKPDNHIMLDWMIPAPAQGAMAIMSMANDDFSTRAASKLNHRESEIATYIEREFLKTLEGGCTAPIGAIAKFDNGRIRFEGVLCSIDGQNRIHIDKIIDVNHSESFGKKCAEEVLCNGGKEIMAEIRTQLKKD